ncbi:MAG: signal peptidase I [Gammaproteobacteria bacterium]|nr:signal peptidase I [Gammaproteobacteria bacterium]
MALIITWAAWAALPVTLLAVLDDWFLRPRRRAAAGPEARDPRWIAVLYHAVPVLLFAALLKLLGSERLDFSLVLVLVVVVAALVTGLDRLWFAAARARAMQAAGREPASQPLPVTVDYARSFLPVAIIVLLIRSFIFEPFRIPSDSMMPTLLDGDFIVVNKYAYGLRLPVLNRKIVDIGAPQRGYVVVFRYPPDPAVNYIKRLVGLPGDRVRIATDQLFINDVAVEQTSEGRYQDGCYHGLRLLTETLGTHRHEVLSCRSPWPLARPAPDAQCRRPATHTYQCNEPEEAEADLLADYGDMAEVVVPPGQYLMIGDNRDNSSDGRFWGFVPADHLVGRAALIWLNWDFQRSGGPIWSRIGRRIH